MLGEFLSGKIHFKTNYSIRANPVVQVQRVAVATRSSRCRPVYVVISLRGKYLYINRLSTLEMKSFD